jgi:hypothetical protein
MEREMSTLPIYVSGMVVVGLIGTTAAICIMLWRGALNAGLSHRTAARVGAGFGIGWAAWVSVSIVLADADVFRFQPTKALPWIAPGILVPLVAVRQFTRMPVVSRILAQPDALWGLTLPQFFRPVGVTFLVAMALGYLPAVFAVPAGLGDLAVGIEAVFVARNIRRGIIGRRVLWFNIFGLADLVAAMVIGFLAAPGRLLVESPSTESISLLPLVLIPTTVVPLAAALHLQSLRKLGVTRKTATVPSPLGV